MNIFVLFCRGQRPISLGRAQPVSAWRRWRARLETGVIGAGFLLAGLGAAGQSTPARTQEAAAAYRAGNAALSRGDLPSAQRQFQRSVELAPELEEVHSALGSVMLRAGRFQEAVRELETALAIQKTDTIALINLAIAYQMGGEQAKALKTFAAADTETKAQKKTLPSYALSNYAKALAAAGNLDQAAAKMSAAIQAEPRNAGLHNDLGSIYAQQQRWKDAQVQFAAALKLNPGLPIAHLRLGLAMQAQGQSGVDELAKAAQLAPKNNAIALEYGRALAKSGQDTHAVEVFRGIIEREQDTSDQLSIAASYELALALQRSGRMAESMELLRRVLAVQPDNAAALTNLGMALSQTQHAKEAVPLLQRAVALVPEDVVAHQNLAAAYVQLNQFADAVVELQAALKLAPDLPQLHYNLGVAYKMQDDAAKAVPELEAAEKLDPQQPESPYLLGVLYMQGGRYEDAARELKTSLTLRAQNGDGWAMLGSVYSKLDRLPEATAALEEAIRQLPRQPDPRLTLAGVLVKQNKTAEATEQRKQAAILMKANMNNQRAEVSTHAGESLLKSGDLAGAAVQFQDALSYDRNYGEAHAGLAKVYEAQGKTVEAAVERQKAVGAKPSSE